MVSGTLRKMRTEAADPVSYFMRLDDREIPLNPLIGTALRLNFSGAIHCIACGRKTSKSFNQGYCFPCMRSLAECDICIVRPEKCHFHKGSCREPQWAQDHCMQDHYVYLANTSGVKIGITRHSQIPTRWIDQGAVQAMPIMRVANRMQSGMIEHLLSGYVADKTNWRKMLQHDVTTVDLPGIRDELLDQAGRELDRLMDEIGADQVQLLEHETPLTLQYPVAQYPARPVSLSFDKTAEVSGVLEGIKGQYLLLDSGVLNLRKFSGYHIELQY